MAKSERGQTRAETVSWGAFKDRIEKFQSHSAAERLNVWFRGQANPEWRLQPSIDRVFNFKTLEERTQRLHALLKAFWKDASGLHRHRLTSSTSATAEMIARHHGLPTSILDWSTSPYIAAFFALQEVLVTRTSAASVWVLQRGLLDDEALAHIEPIEQSETDSANRRAIEQRSVFVRLNSDARYVDAVLPPRALQRFDIAVSDRKLALADLDSMNINARSLFRSMDGAAKSALLRVQDYDEGTG